MIDLKVNRVIDRMVYDDFMYNPFWQGIIELLKKSEIKTVVDIGASSGLSSMWLLQVPTIEKIYCFEPDSENFDMLLKNLEDYLYKIVPLNWGIYYGLKESEVFGTGDKNPLGYTIEPITHYTAQGFRFEKYENKIFKLEELENVINSPADLIKIDIEGSEYNVIKNSTILKEARFLLIAFHNYYDSYVLEFIKEYLPNYEIVIYGPDGNTYFNILLERKGTDESSISGE